MLTLGKPSKPIFLVNHWETFHKKKCGNKTPHQTHPPLPPSSHAPCVHYACVLTIWTSSGHPPPYYKISGKPFPNIFKLGLRRSAKLSTPCDPPPLTWPLLYLYSCTTLSALYCTVLLYCCTVYFCTESQRPVVKCEPRQWEPKFVLKCTPKW